MTKQTSLNKCPKAINFFKKTLKKQTPLTLLVTAFSLLICPGLLLNDISHRINYNNTVEIWDYFQGFTILIFIIALGEMLLLTMVNFSFLYSKRSGDVFHALPLTRNQLLYTRIFSSYIGSAFTMTLCFIGMSLVNFMPDIKGVDLATVLMTYFAMLVMLLLCTLFSSIFAISSGTVFDFIIAIGAVTVAIPAIYAIGVNIVESVTEGVNLDQGEFAFKYTSPFIFAGVTVFSVLSNFKNPVAQEFWAIGSEFNFITPLITIIFSVFCVWILSKLFKIRRSESAGEAYAFRFAPLIINFLVSLVGGYVIAKIFTGSGYADLDFWVFYLIGAVLCSVTVGTIFSRGFKTVKNSLIKGSITVGVALVLCIATIVYAGYIEGYIPRAEDIKTITVGNYNNAIFYDNFDIVLDIHKMAVSDIKNDDTYFKEKDEDIGYSTLVQQVRNFNITYKLKNGSVVKRRYHSLYDNKYDDLIIRYIKSEEYLKRFKIDSEIFKGKIDLSYSEFVGANKAFLFKQGTSDAKTVQKLYETYVDELRNADRKDFFEPISILEISGRKENNKDGEFFSFSLEIPKSFVKTNAIISGLELLTDAEIAEKYGK